MCRDVSLQLIVIILFFTANRLDKIARMREHQSGSYLTCDPVHKKKSYGIEDERELRKKLAMARKSAALREKSKNKRKEQTIQNPFRSVEDYLT